MGIWTPRAKPEVCKFTDTPTTRCLTYLNYVHCMVHCMACMVHCMALYGNEVFNLFKLCALYGALYGLYVWHSLVPRPHLFRFASEIGIVFVHSIPGPDVLRHGQEARDMPAHVYYKRILL